MADRRRIPEERHRFLMGVGLDSDGHARVTQSEEFLLMGGSEGTHELMRETVERFTDTLRRMGTDLQHATGEEMLEAADEAGLLDDDE